MDDTISRQAAIDATHNAYDTCPTFDIIDLHNATVMALNALPPAEPQERKTGRWIDMGDCEQCSACKGTQLKAVNTVYGKAIWIKSPFCPNCGADMREVTDGNHN